MLEKGIIESTDGKTAEVTIQQHSGCENCKVCFFGKRGNRRVTVENSICAQAGDTVGISLDVEANSLKAISIAYLIPLTMLVAAIIIGFAVNLGELITLLIALGALVSGFLAAHFIDKYLGKKSKYKFKMIKLETETDNQK